MRRTRTGEDEQERGAEESQITMHSQGCGRSQAIYPTELGTSVVSRSVCILE